MNTLPPGIMDDSTEIFVTENGLKAITAGRIMDWEELPARQKGFLWRDLGSDQEAMEALQDIESAKERLLIYARCKFGGFNSEPDIKGCGTTTGEHWDCGCTSCPLQGILRGKLKVAHGYLTAREIEVVKLIVTGMPGKQIAAELNMAENTLNNHKRNIFNKTGHASNVELAVWANQINL